VLRIGMLPGTKGSDPACSAGEACPGYWDGARTNFNGLATRRPPKTQEGIG